MYLLVLVGLCVPLALHPILSPCVEEETLSWTIRFGTRANVWLAVYSFIGNYWYVCWLI